MLRTATIVKSLIAVTAITPLLCQAESSLQTGGGALSARAHVDFQITIPKFLFLRVGNGTGNAAGGWGTNGTIDLITFAPAAAQLGNGVAVATTSGPRGGGVETAVVVANHGNVTLSSTTLGRLSDGTGDTISYATIRTVASKLTTAPVLPAPALVDGGTSSVVVAATGKAKMVRRDAKWTYTYRNNALPPAGSYGGVNTNNGRVTYTASEP